MCVVGAFVFVEDECVPELCRSSRSLDQINLPFMQTEVGWAVPMTSEVVIKS